ncbi:NLR family CARD domain-containing protein 4 [Portunus trituberculatus]|uniref:NLR family CARD domain-containing protein 4 n=1 Tax=Portunus trituberculatus TaxID=210409 RepID=A0A5B7EVT1_PORTR|nr:NLR family CARD domain-containing protein 4 [Portunus trituberculatus]
MAQSALALVGSSVHSGIQGEDHHLFRVYKAYASEARLALLQVLSWGCPKPPSQTFDQYLFASGRSRALYRKVFDGQQREKISTNPSGDRFDVSLLFKMIQQACHSLAPPEDEVWTTPDPTRLEYLLTRIKNARNTLVHNVTTTTQEKMVEEIESLRDLLTKVVKISGILYCVNSGLVNQVLRLIHYNLNNIRDQPFAPLDLQDYGNHLVFDSLKATLCLNGAQELKQTYNSKKFLNPISFLDKSECHLQVGEVFTCLSIQDLRACPRSRPVHCKELLELMDTATCDSEGNCEIQNHSLLILEGQPGSGKTTLLRFYVSHWIQGGEDIKGLSDYDLVLHFECRDTCIDSFTQLLLSHMPQTTSKFRKNDLIHVFQSLKAMVLIDGLDELNIASQKVVREILHLKSSCDLTLICTSRAEKIREVHKLVSGKVKVIHMKILGIPIENREEFVQVYHCQLKNHGVPQQNINGLLEYLREVPSHLQDFFRFPLNLVLLTFLWDGAHLRVRKINSMTTLYLEIHRLMIEKFLDRLTYHPSTQNLSHANLATKCESFRATLYEEALHGLGMGTVYLDERGTKSLRELCISLDLPREEVFSAFLVAESYDHTLGLSEKVKFPHKGIQDFYAAIHVTSLVKEGPFPDLSLFLSKLDELKKEFPVPSFAWRQIVKHTKELLSKPVSIRSVLLEFQSESQDIGRYQNVICHMVNLLHSCEPRSLEHYAAELVTLLDEAKGMSFEHWVDILKESHYNPMLAEKISKVLPKFSWTVRDQDVRAAAAFLNHNCPSQLTIDVMNDPNQLPHLHELLQTAATCTTCKVYIFFHHHWRHPEKESSNSLLLKLLPAQQENEHLESPGSPADPSSDYLRDINGPKICLMELMGHFNGQAVHMLPTSIKELRLALADDNDALDWFHALPKLSHMLPSLRNIWIHVTGSVSPDLLPILPQLLYRPRLYLSNVGDDNISWASRVARALLHPYSKYASVGLVRSSLSSRGVSQLAELLHHQDVGVYAGRGGGLLVASTHLSQSDQDVSDSVFHHLNCSLTLLNDDEIWNDESIYEEVYECHNYENMCGGTDEAQDTCSHSTKSEAIYESILPNQAEAVNSYSHKNASSYLDDSESEKNSEYLSSIYEDMKQVTGVSASSSPAGRPSLPAPVPRSDYFPQTDHTPMPARPPLPLPPKAESLCPNADKNFESSLGEYVNLSECVSGSKPPPLPPRCKSSIATPVSSFFHYNRLPKFHTNPPPKPLISRYSINSIESRRSLTTPTEVSSSPKVLQSGPDNLHLKVETDSVKPSPPKYFFPPHQNLPSGFRPSRSSLPTLFPSSSSRIAVDHLSSPGVITQPPSFTDFHPHKKSYKGKPVLPCPLTPKLTSLLPNGDYKRLCNNN